MELAKELPFSTKCCKLETWYERRARKDGKPGKWILCAAWYTPINVCDRCGLRSSPWKVQYRPACASVAGYSGMLCMGCWNVLRRIQQMQDDAEFVRRAAAKILREARKHGNQKRRTA